MALYVGTNKRVDVAFTVVGGGGGGGTAASVSYAGSTNLSATNVEAALDELDSEKLGLSVNSTISGNNTYSGTATFTSTLTNTGTGGGATFTVNSTTAGHGKIEMGAVAFIGPIIRFFGTTTDANPTFQIVNAGITCGPGGGTATDTTLQRQAAGIWNVDLMTPNTQTNNYTLALSDSRKIVRMNSGSSRDVTIPLNSSVAFPVGALVRVTRTGTGAVNIVATGGVTFNSKSGGTAITAQYGAITLLKTATDTWLGYGDI